MPCNHVIVLSCNPLAVTSNPTLIFKLMLSDEYLSLVPRLWLSGAHLKCILKVFRKIFFYFFIFYMYIHLCSLYEKKLVTILVINDRFDFTIYCLPNGAKLIWSNCLTIFFNIAFTQTIALYYTYDLAIYFWFIFNTKLKKKWKWPFYVYDLVVIHYIMDYRIFLPCIPNNEKIHKI